MKIRKKCIVLVLLLTLCSFLTNTVVVYAIEKQPTPNASFDGYNTRLNGLRMGMAVSTDGGGGWILITDSWMESLTLTDDQANQAVAYGLRVKMTGDGVNTQDSDVQGITLTRASNVDNVQGVAPSNGGNTGKLINVTSDMQYKKDSDGGWTDVQGNAVTNLSTGNYMVRSKGNGNTIPGSIKYINIGSGDPTSGWPKAATPSASFDAPSLNLTNVQGMFYSLDGGNNWIFSSGSQVTLTGSDLRTDVGIRVYAPGNNTNTRDSDVQTIGISKANPPSGITAASATATTQGAIYGVNNGMEYLAPGNSSWNTVNNNPLNVPAGIYFLRTKASGTMLASDQLEVIINTDWNQNVPEEDEEEEEEEPEQTSQPIPEPTPVPQPTPEKQSRVAEPSVVGRSDIVGWDAIVDNLTSDPLTINMNGTSVIPVEVLEEVKAQKSQLNLGMDDNVVWNIRANSSVNPTDDADLKMRRMISAIPEDLLKTVADSTNYVEQFSLAKEGDFGFDATLSFTLSQLGHSGRTARLYYYNTSKNALELIDDCQVNQKNAVAFDMTHASYYAVVVGERLQQTIENNSENSSTETKSGTLPQPQNKKASKANTAKAALVVAAIIIVCIAGIVIVSKASGKKKKRANHKKK